MSNLVSLDFIITDICVFKQGDGHDLIDSVNDFKQEYTYVEECK